MNGVVILRDVQEEDLPVFYRHQSDPEANRMAAFPARDWPAFIKHWTKILAENGVNTKTILFDGQVAGNIASFDLDGQRQVGYWIGRELWGKGIATRALTDFLTIVTSRPLYGYVARHNTGSARVLEKCGFRRVGEDTYTPVGGEPVDEFVYRLD